MLYLLTFTLLLLVLFLKNKLIRDMFSFISFKADLLSSAPFSQSKTFPSFYQNHNKWIYLFLLLFSFTYFINLPRAYSTESETPESFNPTIKRSYLYSSFSQLGSDYKQQNLIIKQSINPDWALKFNYSRATDVNSFSSNRFALGASYKFNSNIQPYFNIHTQNDSEDLNSKGGVIGVNLKTEGLFGSENMSYLSLEMGRDLLTSTAKISILEDGEDSPTITQDTNLSEYEKTSIFLLLEQEITSNLSMGGSFTQYKYSFDTDLYDENSSSSFPLTNKSFFISYYFADIYDFEMSYHTANDTSETTSYLQPHLQIDINTSWAIDMSYSHYLKGTDSQAWSIGLSYFW